LWLRFKLRRTPLEVNRARIVRNASIVGHQKDREKVARDLDRALSSALKINSILGIANGV
jgi:hypothetical protein